MPYLRTKMSELEMIDISYRIIPLKKSKTLFKSKSLRHWHRSCKEQKMYVCVCVCVYMCVRTYGEDFSFRSQKHMVLKTQATYGTIIFF